MFFLLYKRTANGVFDYFPTISHHFPRISENFQNCPKEQTNVFFVFFLLTIEILRSVVGHSQN